MLLTWQYVPSLSSAWHHNNSCTVLVSRFPYPTPLEKMVQAKIAGNAPRGIENTLTQSTSIGRRETSQLPIDYYKDKCT